MKEPRKEGIKASVVGVWKFLQHYKDSGTIERQAGSGRPTRATAEIKTAIESQLEKDDETTAFQLRTLLLSEGHTLSLSTIQRARSHLGWTFRGSAYCQLIWEQNKEKRLQWARDNVDSALSDGFTDVVWTDEASVQLESHRRHSFRKSGCLPKPKPKYKM